MQSVCMEALKLMAISLTISNSELNNAGTSQSASQSITHDYFLQCSVSPPPAGQQEGYNASGGLVVDQQEQHRQSASSNNRCMNLQVATYQSSLVDPRWVGWRGLSWYAVSIPLEATERK